MRKRRFMQCLVATLLLVTMLFQGTWVLAGTTGSLSGIVLETGKSTPVTNAHIAAVSPSQNATTTTDQGGHFIFASLAPDTYTISVEKQGFDTTSQAGVNIFADQSQTLTLQTQRTLREIGRVLSRASTDLVKPGTTADVYSVNAVQQDKFAGVGGGGGLNNAYSAIATVPGAYVPSNQAGYFQTILIRGGDYDQVGYELDGVPVNRSFDNYPSGTASSLGQQELQVYTGAAPANAEGQGLSGFINQVIRTGTYPGFANLNLSVGGPTFYHKANFEFGGATPSRNFSYYVGVGGYNQDFRYVDQFNGDYARAFGSLASVQPCATDPTGGASYYDCYANGTAAPAGFNTTGQEFGSPSNISVRDTVANFHFGLPHRHDGGKDDIQLLLVNNFINTAFFSSFNDLGAVAAGQTKPFNYVDGYSFNASPGQFLPSNYQALTGPYLFPSSPQNRPFGSPIATDTRDTYQNDQGIVKLQYQKNFSSSAYFRLYGYTYYSDWLINGPNFASYARLLNLGGISRDYELSSHTRGISGTFADQINAQNLLQIQGSFTTASTLRDNNTQLLNSGGGRSRFAVAVDSNDPTNGLCYKVSGATGTPTVCNPLAGKATFATLPQAFKGTIPNISGATCGTGPCRFYVLENGLYATYNTVKPSFTAFSITDNFKPTDKLLFNLGLRYDGYAYQGTDTTGTAARALLFKAFNMDYCYTPTSGAVSSKPSLGVPVTAPCPAGTQATNLVNTPSQQFYYPVIQPRAGFTYTLNPDTVIRGSYGRYAQAPNTAFEQYNQLQQNLPGFLGTAFYKYGFRTPGHAITPATSNNYDISLEHHLKGTDMSFKLTPFYRYTQNQIQTFFLDQPSGFVSGLNADRLTSRGVEFQFNKGDFARNGWAAQLSFTYTNAYAQYNRLSNGATVFDGINTDIQNYNAYTKFCGTNPNDSRCNGSAANAVPCYATDGTPDPACAAGSIANPYFNAPVQNLVDVNGKYQPFSLVTGPIGASANSYLVPYVSTLIFQYKKDRLAITPSLQFTGGQRYGVPETSPGIDPAQGCTAYAGALAGDSRYPYGAPGGAPYDASSCAGLLNAIPNPYTKQFDNIGAFVNPSQLQANMQISYDASKRITFVANLTNILNTCFGGSNVPWAVGGPHVCSYGLISAGNSAPPVGNVYNPNSIIQPALKYPYERSYGAFNTDGSSTNLPFSIYLDARIKI